VLRRNQSRAELHPDNRHRILLPIMGSLQRFEVPNEVHYLIGRQV
jgi:ribosomal protein L21E